jgi:hypothetical protein
MSRKDWKIKESACRDWLILLEREIHYSTAFSTSLFLLSFPLNEAIYRPMCRHRFTFRKCKYRNRNQRLKKGTSNEVTGYLLKYITCKKPLTEGPLCASPNGIHSSRFLANDCWQMISSCNVGITTDILIRNLFLEDSLTSEAKIWKG